MELAALLDLNQDLTRHATTETAMKDSLWMLVRRSAASGLKGRVRASRRDDVRHSVPTVQPSD